MEKILSMSPWKVPFDDIFNSSPVNSETLYNKALLIAIN